jgi:hypothetical protein
MDLYPQDELALILALLRPADKWPELSSIDATSSSTVASTLVLLFFANFFGKNGK